MTPTPYKKLAYERATFMALARVLQERFLVVEGAMEPEQVIECEDLPRNECRVPDEVLRDAVLRLHRMASYRARDMSCYKLVVTTEQDDEQEWEDNVEQKPEKVASKGSDKQAAPAVRQGKEKGSKGDSQATTVGAGKPKSTSPAGKGGR